MNSLSSLIRFESAGSRLILRDRLYGTDEDAAIVIDCIALANADAGPVARYVLLGVDDSVAGHRRMPGIEKHALVAFKQRCLKLLARTVEPRLSANVRAIAIDGALIGVICIDECRDTPYLARKNVGSHVQAGAGFIRRGPRNMPLRREELRRMFSAQTAPSPEENGVTIEFCGSDSGDQLYVPALPLNKIPSELAANRLQSMLEAMDHAKDVFGRTETQFSRLMHAKLYGVEVPFEHHSDDSLVSSLDRVHADYKAADAHYCFELRAHKINFLVKNNAPSDLEDARLELSLARLPGIGIADRIYPESDDITAGDGYPMVAEFSHSIVVDASLGVLHANRRREALRQSLRFWAREEAAGKSVTLDYKLTALGLSEPVEGALVICIEPSGLRGV